MCNEEVESVVIAVVAFAVKEGRRDAKVVRVVVAAVQWSDGCNRWWW